MKKLFLILLLPALCLAATVQLAAGCAPLPNDVLLISDQTDEVTSPPNFDEYYEDALNDYSVPYSYDKLVHSSDITSTELDPYNMVVWYTGVSAPYPSNNPKGHATLTLDEESALVNWLNATPSGETRGLWLSGRFIAYNCIADTNTQGQIYSQLFSGYFGLDYPQDNFTDPISVNSDWVGEAWSGRPPMWGYSKAIFWRSSTGGNNIPDMLASTGAGWGALKWTDPSSNDHYASMIANTGTSANGGTWKVVLSALPLECIGDESQHDEQVMTMRDILDWFNATAAIEETTWGQLKAQF
ncbi:hypothetical protein K8R78_05125 [bacterium]|nr:hypothetical protein [bacterium]